MALTLEEASKLSNDMLLQGVVETIIKDSPVLKELPFIEIVGNGLTYNQEKTLPTIDFYDVDQNKIEECNYVSNNDVQVIVDNSDKAKHALSKSAKAI